MIPMRQWDDPTSPGCTRAVIKIIGFLLELIVPRFLSMLASECTLVVTFFSIGWISQDRLPELLVLGYLLLVSLAVNLSKCKFSPPQLLPMISSSNCM